MTNYWSIQLEFDFSCRSFSQFTFDVLLIRLELQELRHKTIKLQFFENSFLKTFWEINDQLLVFTFRFQILFT